MLEGVTYVPECLPGGPHTPCPSPSHPCPSMALRRLSLVHSHLQAAVSVRAASWKNRSEKPPGEHKPICPGNAFTLFLETQPRENKSLKKFVHEAACKWNSLPQEEKIVFQQQAIDLEKRYHDEISTWEKRMLQMGRKDLVERHHQLTDGKNQTIERHRLAMKDHGQDLTQTVEVAGKEEKELSTLEGEGSMKKGAAKKKKSSAKEEINAKEEIKEEGDPSVPNSRSVSVPKSFKSKHKQINLIKVKKHFYKKN